MIGLTGAHRTGKSTLARLVSEETRIPFIKQEYANKIANAMGIDIAGTVDFSTHLAFHERIMDAVISTVAHASKTHGVFITDRTPLDVLAYTIADVNRDGGYQRFDKRIFNLEKRALDAVEKYYHIVVHVPVVKDIPYVAEAGKPLPVLSYQRHIDMLIGGISNADRIYEKTYMMNEEIVTPEKRTAWVIKMLSEKLESYEDEKNMTGTH